MDNETPKLAKCYAAYCKFNNNGSCKMAGLEIGKNGTCMNFAKWTKKKLRQYLAARGLSDTAVERIIAEAEKNAGVN